jgi:metal-sulfur cluster biosynthetic enzyme
MSQDLLTECPAGIDGNAVLDRLSRVLDPELDEPIVQLGFVRNARIEGGRAIVTLHLPTSWCAINFAFMMAEDIRAALLTVDGISQVTVRFDDHASADEIETAVNDGQSFATAFPCQGGGSLASLRAVFLRKGLLIRQERLLRELRAAGLSPTALAALSIGDATAGNTATASTLNAYLERRAELGFDCTPAAPLIVDQTGAAVPGERMETHYNQVRTTRVSMEANGSFCRAVLATRRAARSASFKTINPEGTPGGNHVQA